MEITFLSAIYYDPLVAHMTRIIRVSIPWLFHCWINILHIYLCLSVCLSLSLSLYLCLSVCLSLSLTLSVCLSLFLLSLPLCLSLSLFLSLSLSLSLLLAVSLPLSSYPLSLSLLCLSVCISVYYDPYSFIQQEWKVVNVRSAQWQTVLIDVYISLQKSARTITLQGRIYSCYVMSTQNPATGALT